MSIDKLLKIFDTIKKILSEFDYDIVSIADRDDAGMIPAVMTYANNYVNIIVLRENGKLIFHIEADLESLESRASRNFSSRGRDIISLLKDELYGITADNDSKEIWVECESCRTTYSSQGSKYACPNCNSFDFKLSEKLHKTDVI